VDTIEQAVCCTNFRFLRNSEQFRRTQVDVQMARHGNVPSAVDASFPPDVIGDPVLEEFEAVPPAQLNIFVAWAGLRQSGDEGVHIAAYLDGQESKSGVIIQ
jgi:hypothetical protein